MRMRNWAVRGLAVAAGATVLVGGLAVPAQAAINYTASTTGAKGRATYVQNGDYNLFATDTLSDGHCAQWQRKFGSGSWAYFGDSNCTSTEKFVAFGHSDAGVPGGVVYRICRTGVGNCSSPLSLG